MAELSFPSAHGGHLFILRVSFPGGLRMYLLPPRHICLSLLNHKLLEAKGLQLCLSLDAPGIRRPGTQ